MSNICSRYYSQYLTKQGYKIFGAKTCGFGDKCKYKHDIIQLQEIKGNYKKWKNKNKNHIDMKLVKENIINILNKEKSKVRKKEYVNIISHINSLNLKELLFFWNDISVYYTNIYKELPYKKQKYRSNVIDGYRFKEDVPNFTINNNIDIKFLIRTMMICPKFEKLLKTKKQHINGLCSNFNNCSNGVHSKTEYCCYNDLLNGECNNDNCKYIHYTKNGLLPLNTNEIILTNDDYLKRPVIRIKKKKFV
jgi:hypothetical protein